MCTNARGKKGYRHLFHKLILLVVHFGEVLDVVLKPHDVTFHGGQTALQDLSRHCRRKRNKKDKFIFS